MFKNLVKGFLLISAFSTLFNIGCAKCPKQLPFLDIKEIDIELDDTVLNIGEALEFVVRYERIQYLSEKGLSLVPFYNNAAYAASTCDADGQLGLKFPVTAVDVFSNISWDNEHPPGTSLVDFMEIAIPDGDTGVLSFVNMNEYITTMSDGFNPEDTRFRISPSESISGNVFLSVTVSKSDGSALIKNLPVIKWN